MRPSIELASPGEAEVLSLGFAFLFPFIPRFVLRCRADGDHHHVINFSFSGCRALRFPQIEVNLGIFPLAVQDSWGSSTRCDLGDAGRCLLHATPTLPLGCVGTRKSMQFLTPGHILAC